MIKMRIQMDVNGEWYVEVYEMDTGKTLYITSTFSTRDAAIQSARESLTWEKLEKILDNAGL